VSTARTQLTSESILPRWRMASRSDTLEWVAGVLILALAYFTAAKLGQTLRYTASVSAIWPPAGLGIAALYLWGLRWWPGIFLGECLVNGDLLFSHVSLPLGSLAGQQLGNMAEVIVGAWLLRRLIGPRAGLDRAKQVAGMAVAVGVATAISATVGTLSMLAGDVINASHAPTFWRTWWLGDTAGVVVVLPLVLTWLLDPKTAWRARKAEGVLLIVSVTLLSVAAVTTTAPLTYLIFPALFWAAFRFGPAGATLAVAINAGVTVGVTADRLGVFFSQPIDNRTLSTQLYILVGAFTALFVAAVVSERERSAAELIAARRRTIERGREERLRIARDLHDSVSQALFSSVLHTRAAQKTLVDTTEHPPGALTDHLQSIAELTRRAQAEMRRFIFEWGPESVREGLVPVLQHHASTLVKDTGISIHVHGPALPLPLTDATQAQLYGIGREALANVVRHSGAASAGVHIDVDDSQVIMKIVDDGAGFDPATARPGHYGLESMRSRAREIDADFEIRSSPGVGTSVRVTVAAEGEPEPDGA
jgi:signal transduction histidine kinase